MSFTKTSAGFTRMQKILHWAVVVLLALQFFVFDGMGRGFHDLMDTGVAPYTVTSVAHIVIGVFVLALALWRLVLRIQVGVPAAPEAEPDRGRKASGLAHLALLFLLPVSGLVAWFGAVGFAAQVHEILTTALSWIVILHVSAVAVHQFYWKTNLLSRMH